VEKELVPVSSRFKCGDRWTKIKPAGKFVCARKEGRKEGIGGASSSSVPVLCGEESCRRRKIRVSSKLLRAFSYLQKGYYFRESRASLLGSLINLG
jgi:hypothetical protein